MGYLNGAIGYTPATRPGMTSVDVARGYLAHDDRLLAAQLPEGHVIPSAEEDQAVLLAAASLGNTAVKLVELEDGPKVEVKPTLVVDPAYLRGGAFAEPFPAQA